MGDAQSPAFPGLKREIVTVGGYKNVRPIEVVLSDEDVESS